MLKLQNISVQFGAFCLKNINLNIEKGDYYVLLGKSGTGKTVLLEIIAGLTRPAEGKVFLKNEDITKKKIQHRKIGIVFQDFALFPHLTVRENVAYSLKKKKLTRTEKENMVLEYAKLTNVSHILDRSPQNLSGGEQQRVALARMLITKPDCLLLDEPLSSLDVQLRGDLRNLLRQINKSGVTILHVTHDYEEAIALSNKVAVLHQGKIAQFGNTKDVFEKPANEFVANFTGVKNFYEVAFTSETVAIIGDTTQIIVSNRRKLKHGKIIIRGEEILIATKKTQTSAANHFEGDILQIIPYLSNYEIIVDVGIRLTVVITENSLLKFDFQIGQKVWLSFKSTAVKIIDI